MFYRRFFSGAIAGVGICVFKVPLPGYLLSWRTCKDHKTKRSKNTGRLQACINILNSHDDFSPPVVVFSCLLSFRFGFRIVAPNIVSKRNSFRKHSPPPHLYHPVTTSWCGTCTHRRILPCKTPGDHSHITIQPPRHSATCPDTVRLWKK